MTRNDLPLLHRWLHREHVRRWWDDLPTLDDVSARYGPAVDGEDPTEHYVILLDGTPSGMIETYLAEDYAEEWPVGAEPGVAGIDLFISEDELVGKGLGPRVLRAFLDQVIFARPGVTACIAGPDVRNAASIRAFEKAGFRRWRVVEFPGEHAPEQLLRIERKEVV
jgi:aminoglycoside 6'-N-acetyltransferase